MSAARKLIGLYVGALLLTYRTETIIIIAVMFLISVYVLARAIGVIRGRARRSLSLARGVLGTHRASAGRSPTRAIANLAREVAYGERYAMIPTRAVPIRALIDADDPDGGLIQCPECSSPDVQAIGNTSYRCRDCGMRFP